MECQACGFPNLASAEHCVFCWHPTRPNPAGWLAETPRHAVSLTAERAEAGVSLSNSSGVVLARLRRNDSEWTCESVDGAELFVVQIEERGGEARRLVVLEGEPIATIRPGEFIPDTVDVCGVNGNVLARLRFSDTHAWAEVELGEGEQIGFLYAETGEAPETSSWHLDLDVLPPHLDWSVLLTALAVQCMTSAPVRA
jgi:hypothetical protein